jgi:hypothetical protein
MMIPCGLSSEATVKDDKYCVQTEFAQRPKPRVTTTISLNGEVVDKVENNWENPPLTEADKQNVERFLKKQHQKVLEKIRTGDDQFTAPEGDEGQIHPDEEDAVVKVHRELSETSGVLGWTFILQDGQILSHRISEPGDKVVLRQVKDLSSLLPSVSHLGSFTGGTLESPQRLSLFVPVRAHFLGVKLEPQTDPRNLVKRIKAIA